LLTLFLFTQIENKIENSLHSGRATVGRHLADVQGVGDEGVGGVAEEDDHDGHGAAADGCSQTTDEHQQQL